MNELESSFLPWGREPNTGVVIVAFWNGPKICRILGHWLPKQSPSSASNYCAASWAFLVGKIFVTETFPNSFQKMWSSSFWNLIFDSCVALRCFVLFCLHFLRRLTYLSIFQYLWNISQPQSVVEMAVMRIIFSCFFVIILKELCAGPNLIA